MKKNIISVTILLFSLYNAQSLNIKSPQSYEMERYGNVPVNLNVGGIDLSIPLFEQKFNSIGDFKLSLNYNSAGFIPNKKSNYVGQDWFLNFGGVISRTINGIADDSDVSENTFSSKGFLVGTRLGPKSNLDVYNGAYSTSYWKDHVSINGYQYELRPDKFSFNFMGISGYFYIGNDGIPIAVSEDMNLKIDVSNLANQQNYECAPQDSEIVITDGKGIKYYFGGNHNNLEVSYQMGNSKDPAQFLPNGQGIFSITSWYLRKVEYPNNHLLEIEYLKYKKFDSDWEMPGLGNFCTITQPPQQSSFDFVEEFFDFNKYVNQRNQRFSYNYDTSMGGYHVWGDGSGFSYQAPYFQYTLTKKAFPSKIILDGKQLVGFNYTRFPSNDNNYQSLKLNSVEIKNQDVLIKKIDFSYYRNKDTFFLTAITFPNNTKYTFDYYNKESLPKSTTLGIDFWGFWNGQDENSNYLIPKYSFNADTGDYQVTGTSRNSNSSLVNTGLLKIVNYPTGGNSTFIYEPHTYSKKLERDFSSDFLPYIKSESGAVGGARISKIINFDGVNTVARDFKYIRNYGSGSTESSGVATQILRYMDYIDYKNAGAGRTQVLTETAQNISENSLSSSPINYSEVAELANNVFQKKYYFSDYSTNPDALVEYSNVSGLDDVKPYKLTKNFFIRHNSNDNQRGKLLKTQIFKDGNVIQEEENTYTTLEAHPLLKNSFFSRVQQLLPWVHYQKEYLYPYLLNSATTRDYLNGNIISIKTDYFYEGKEHLNLTKTKTSYPTNENIENDYQYATDVRLGYFPYAQYPGFAFIYNMLSKNATGIPVVTTAYKNGVLKKRELIRYNSAISPSDRLSYSEDKTIPSTPNVPDVNFATLEISYNQYDDKGNLQQYTTKDGLSTVIIWGYNQTQPIAKIEGAKLTDIQQSLIDSIVNASNADALSTPNADETILLSALNAFRNNLAAYQVSTYTYDPLIGVRSITPPSGIRESYLYDSANRLEKVVDANGKVLKEMKYNYKQ
ncbi:uncharacterized protein CHSO_4139 [Chryseobacterium sp. StRB126]|uniref:RHS repeat protein n=1 Tax=Chryseobacterium sp. StRB126 TaxID=878220 RepID=UPI0004E98D28|nr:RHS repeat protein [Chryseobacterium sp. StRB126]BAP33176.1 uncharacterized protein CHSO_4139 [Chryseobacterium sp. StRB126]